MRIIPLIKLQHFRKRKMHITHHCTPKSIWACILPHVRRKSPERACLPLPAPLYAEGQQPPSRKSNPANIATHP